MSSNMETKRTVVPAAEEILGLYYPVLDHGFVSLKSYMGSDTDIEMAARISYAYETRKVTETRGLIRYLRRHHHTTPIETVEMQFHCILPIFVARQFVRHRTQTFNELSARYSLVPMLFYTPEHEHFQAQSTSNKQGGDGALPQEMYDTAVSSWQEGRANSRQLYEDLAFGGVARETARIDLPLSTYTQWYSKVDLHNLLGFLTLRCDSHAQYEIRAYADVIAGMVKRVAPLTYDAWIDYQFCATTFSRQEKILLDSMIEGLDEPTTAELSAKLGMTKREYQEFSDKMNATATYPDHHLHRSDFVASEVVAAKLNAEVPNQGV